MSTLILFAPAFNPSLPLSLPALFPPQALLYPPVKLYLDSTDNLCKSSSRVSFVPESPTVEK